jgi:hypothetical protein
MERRRSGVEKTATRLLELSDQQEEALRSHRAFWETLATASSPTDRTVAAAAFAALYRSAGLKPPTVRWYGSPALMLKADASAALSLRAGDNVWHSVGGLLGDRVWRTLWQHIETEVGVKVWKSLRGTLWQTVTRYQSWNGPVAGAEAPYCHLPEGREPGTLAAIEHNDRVELLACQHLERWEGRTGEVFTDECWIGELLPTAAFFAEAIGIEELDEVGPLVRLAASAGPWIARERMVLVCERPTRFQLDEQGRLHSEDGPALAYPEGEPLYCWHGVQVPATVITGPQAITPEEIRAQPNAEVRRVMVERYGIERLVTEGGLRLRHHDEYGKLWDTGTDNTWEAGWLELQNSTAEPDGSFKTYFLLVPPAMETAHEAVAWTFGMREHEYQIAAES